MPTRIIILGKPNVGKSSLFNIFLKKNIAIVDDFSGLTRDVRKKKIKLWDKECILFDTPGIINNSSKDLDKKIKNITFDSAKLADLIVLVFDGKSELSSLDHDIVQIVRKLNKKTMIVINKAEGRTNESVKEKLETLGFGTPILVSASHNQNIDQLRWFIYESINMNNDDIDDEKNEDLSIAIVGKTNTGKSTIFNLINRKKISITGSEPNLTRDSVESIAKIEKLNCKIFDTAGFSNKNKDKINKLSTDQTLKKIRLSKLILMIFDINNYYEKINSKLINLIYSEYRCLVILVNKIDTLKGFSEKIIHDHIKELNPQIRDIPVLFVSAKDNIGFENLHRIIEDQIKIWRTKIKTNELNQWLNNIMKENPPPLKNGKIVKLKYIAQVNVSPPKFNIFSNFPNSLNNQYKRFISNKLKKEFNLKGLPIKIFFKKTDNPYEKN